MSTATTTGFVCNGKRQNDDCQALTKSKCGTSFFGTSIDDLCPVMCGLCTSTTFPSTMTSTGTTTISSTGTSTVTTGVCNGKPDPSECSQYPNFGLTCESVWGGEKIKEKCKV